jgi:hypothetical protein
MDETTAVRVRLVADLKYKRKECRISPIEIADRVQPLRLSGD